LYAHSTYQKIKSKLSYSIYAGLNYSLKNLYRSKETSGGFSFLNGMSSIRDRYPLPFAIECKVHYQINPKLQIGTGLAIHNNFYGISFNSFKDIAASRSGMEFYYVSHFRSIPFIITY
jgi:hypothetical protein